MAWEPIRPRGTAVKVELDRRSLFALASDTRLEMLKALQSNRRTVSQLAEVLEIDKAAIHRHLKKLEEGGLVARTEDHGFVYYALTWKSRDILDPTDKTKIVILISSATICLLAMALVVYMGAFPGVTSPPSDNMEATNESPARGDGGAASEGTSSLAEPFPLLPVLVLASLAGGLGILVWRFWAAPIQRGGENTSDMAGGEGTNDQ